MEFLYYETLQTSALTLEFLLWPWSSLVKGVRYAKYVNTNSPPQLQGILVKATNLEFPFLLLCAKYLKAFTKTLWTAWGGKILSELCRKTVTGLLSRCLSFIRDATQKSVRLNIIRFWENQFDQYFIQVLTCVLLYCDTGLENLNL